MDCGEVFNEYTANCEVHDEPACPCCFSTNFDDAWQCKDCGSWFTEEEGESYLCNDCLEDYAFLYRHDAKKMYKFSEGTTETIEINGFLASRFTAPEIEEILLKELASAVEMQDYIDYIKRDTLQFAEYIEEVIEDEQKESEQG
jgi:hypothetical protein